MLEQTVKLIEREKLIVIARSVERDKLLPLFEALYKGGVRIAELPYDPTLKTSDTLIAEEISMLDKHFGGEMLFGAGTVYNSSQIKMTSDSGGKFVISPNTDTEIIKGTKAIGLVSIPGALTPTEIVNAVKAGADFVKLFPVSALGTEYIQLIRTPIPFAKLIAIGKIGIENIKEYKDAGICGFGIGTNIVNHELIENGDFDKICENAKRYVDAIKG